MRASWWRTQADSRDGRVWLNSTYTKAGCPGISLCPYRDNFLPLCMSLCAEALSVNIDLPLPLQKRIARSNMACEEEYVVQAASIPT